MRLCDRCHSRLDVESAAFELPQKNADGPPIRRFRFHVYDLCIDCREQLGQLVDRWLMSGPLGETPHNPDDRAGSIAADTHGET